MTQEAIPLIPTAEDYQLLLTNNQLATEQLKSIIFARLLAEKDSELTALKKKTEGSEESGDSEGLDNVTPIGQTGD